MRGEGWKNNKLVEVTSRLAIMRPMVGTFGGVEGLVMVKTKNSGELREW